MDRLEENQGKYSISFSWLLYIPIIIGIAIIPLIMRFTLVDVKEEEYARLFNQVQIVDIFSQYKAGAVIATAALMLIILFLAFDKANLKKDRFFKICSIGALIYGFFTIIAASVSEYSDIAWWGAPDRAEGAVVLIGYLVLMYYTSYVIQQRKDVKYVIVPLVILTCIIAFIGFFQYIGEDLLLTREWGNKLIIPKQYEQYRGGLTGMHDKGKIYGTMYHYNYIGSFGAIILPLFTTLLLFAKNNKNRLVFGIATLCSALVLFGSTSRAGLIGLALSIVVFCILFAKRIIKGWKIGLPILGIVIIGLFVFNNMTSGTLFSRIPSLVNDMMAIFVPADEQADYKSQLPIQGIENGAGEIIVKTSQGDLIISSGQQDTLDSNTLMFRDDSGEAVSATLEGETFRLEDPRFENITIDKRSDIAEGIEKWLIEYNKERIFYFAVEGSEVYYVNPITYEKEEWQESARIGFYGKERVGSARGYIWSRSLPLLKDAVVTGYGPDTFALYFPQDDYLGKWASYDTTNMIVDKPHNLYLQIALNQGVAALIGFLILIGTYLVQGVKLYAFKEVYSNFEIAGSAILLGIVGYLGAGLFNDSIVSVAPVFWILLGAGIAINFLIQKEKDGNRQAIEHATISLKTKKHIRS